MPSLCLYNICPREALITVGGWWMVAPSLVPLPAPGPRQYLHVHLLGVQTLLALARAAAARHHRHVAGPPHPHHLAAEKNICEL